jgi:hypothetical protein
MKTRIVELTLPNGKKIFEIQQRRFLIWGAGESDVDWLCDNRYYSLDEAKAKLPYFDGTKIKREVVFH